MADWTETHRPTTLTEVRGNDKARDALREWAEAWSSHQEAVIIHGSPGIGKTSAAHALAADLGWDVIELNASDQRTAAVIERIAGEAAKSGTLTAGESGRKLVVIDEADNLHGNADRGGSRAITELVKDADQPVVLIANEYYEMSRGLRNACREIEFRDVSKRSIIPVLRDICRQEEITYEDAALEAIASKNAGDLRGAINDLQALAEATTRLTADAVVTSDRDRTQGVFEYLDTLIKDADAEEALRASYAVDETPDDLINWIEDNLPKDYHDGELADAYASLATADRWLGRVRATQEYSYWRYVTDNMTAGVAAARREEKGGWTRYGPPSYWSKLGRSRAARDTRDYIARQIAETSGVSMGTARREIMPHLAVMTHHCKNRELTVAMTAAYEFDAKHVSFITGSGEDTNKVQDIVADAEALREDAVEAHGGSAFEVSTMPAESETSQTTGTGADGAVEDEEEARSENSGEEEDETALEQQANFSDFT